MQEPTPHSSRLALAGGLMALLIAGGGGFIIGRSTAPEAAPVISTPPTPIPAPPATATAITPLPTLERAGLLSLVSSALDDADASLPRSAAVHSTTGRRFDLVVPFGCEGQIEGERTTPFGWHYDEAKMILRVWINPMRWGRAAWALAESEEPSTFEGFWINRPWSTATSCPSASKGAAAPTAEPDQLQGEVAIARLITGDADESSRRLEIVKRMEPGDFDPAQGFALRITGRLQSDQPGGPVRCLERGSRQQRPQCLIFGDFSELRVENPKTGEELGVWPINEASQRD